MEDQTHATNKDPFLLNYNPSERRIASEFLGTWLPFLSRDLCTNCAQSLSDRIRSIDPHPESQSLGDDVSNVQPQEMSDGVEDNCDAHSLGSWNDGAEANSNFETPRMSWADMAQEDDDFDEVVHEQKNKKFNVVVAASNSNSNSSEAIQVVAEKPTLPREQREYIRFMDVRRKKDFKCFERVHGKLVNILEGLELHTGIY
ncbi:RNA demethylase ALKBH9B-like [Gastrolobium bilobum]|uniref:RNA demethylase ALKBH9B-like n=1 Tax=Gastrolobium bilobum TaxID=150636 RepID=UPI002AB0D947|nr:RNA demethylase ALKBH9B-like [Gastrolobium bilobum]